MNESRQMQTETKPTRRLWNVVKKCKRTKNALNGEQIKYSENEEQRGKTIKRRTSFIPCSAMSLVLRVTSFGYASLHRNSVMNTSV